MSSITVTVEPLAGSDIGEACSDIVNLADKIGIPVQAVFNGVTVYARPGDSAGNIEASWHLQIRSTSRYKFASDRGPK